MVFNNQQDLIYQRSVKDSSLGKTRALAVQKTASLENSVMRRHEVRDAKHHGPQKNNRSNSCPIPVPEAPSRRAASIRPTP